MTRRISPLADSSAIAVCTAQTVLAYPPTQYAVVPDSWTKYAGVIPEFDLAIWAAAATDLSNAELLAGICHPIAILDDDVDVVDFANNELDVNAHSYKNGDGPFQLTTTNTLPTGLELATDYYVILVNANTIKLATTRALALAGTAVAFSDVGVGTHTIEDTADTMRMHWHSFGLLGINKDGDVTLTDDRAQIGRMSHTPRAIAYGIVATLSAAENVSAAIYPVVSP